MKKKLRERPTRELTVSELIAHTGSPYQNSRKQSYIKIKAMQKLIGVNFNLFQNIKLIKALVID